MRKKKTRISFLPDPTDTNIRGQIKEAFKRGWAVEIELTPDASQPRNPEGNQLFLSGRTAQIMRAVKLARKSHPDHYIKINAIDYTPGYGVVRRSFLAHRPNPSAHVHTTGQQSFWKPTGRKLSHLMEQLRFFGGHFTD